MPGRLICGRWKSVGTHICLDFLSDHPGDALTRLQLQPGGRDSDSRWRKSPQISTVIQFFFASAIQVHVHLAYAYCTCTTRGKVLSWAARPVLDGQEDL